MAQGQETTITADIHDRPLRLSTVGIHISTRPAVAEKLLKRDALLRVSRAVRQTRAFGCGQLALAFVATGRLQAFFQLDVPLYDQVAGIVLIKNAGGCARDLTRGGNWRHTTKDLLATANEGIADEFSTLWKKTK